MLISSLISPSLSRRSLLAAVAALPLTARAARYTLRRPMPLSPLTAVVTWTPRKTGDLVLALHGHQSADADPTWFAWLRTQPDFANTALLVPAVADPMSWSSPEVLAALTAHIGALNPTRTFLLGFSSGASQGFHVAAALADRLSGFAALAGSLPHDLDPKALADVPVLLGCMSEDTGVPCEALDTSAATLTDAGVSVTRHTFEGIGHECPLDRVAPVLANWMKAR